MAEKQRIFHIVTEILGVALGIFLIIIGSSYCCMHWPVRAALVIAGIAGIIIDGYCITTWRKKKRHK
jgi:hypothetical protein